MWILQGVLSGLRKECLVLLTRNIGKKKRDSRAVAITGLHQMLPVH